VQERDRIGNVVTAKATGPGACVLQKHDIGRRASVRHLRRTWCPSCRRSWAGRTVEPAGGRTRSLNTTPMVSVKAEQAQRLGCLRARTVRSAAASSHSGKYARERSAVTTASAPGRLRPVRAVAPPYGNAFLDFRTRRWKRFSAPQGPPRPLFPLWPKSLACHAAVRPDAHSSDYPIFFVALASAPARTNSYDVYPLSRSGLPTSPGQGGCEPVSGPQPARGAGAHICVKETS
jgi:hypothetical protein